MASPLQPGGLLPLWTFLLLVGGLAEAGKLLVLPMDGSHWLSMRVVVEELHQRGHELVIITPEVSWRLAKSAPYTVKTYKPFYSLEDYNQMFKRFADNQWDNINKGLLSLMNPNITLFFEYVFSNCKSLFKNTELLQYIKENAFDAIFFDPFDQCGFIVAKYFSLPSVVFSRGLFCHYQDEATQCPSPLSYVPRGLSGFSDSMTFMERVWNHITHLQEMLLCPFFFQITLDLATDVLQRPMTLKELYRDTSIWMLRSDFVFDYPKPVMPNVVFVGGITCHEAKPLSQLKPSGLPASPFLGKMSQWESLVLKFFLPLLALATGDKLLVVPMDGSHWLSMLPVLEQLSLRGHEVVVLLPHRSLWMKSQDTFTAKIYQVPYTKEQLSEALNVFVLANLQKHSWPLPFVKILQSLESFMKVMETSCESLLKSTELIQDLQESHFDALLTNPLLVCGTILAEHLSLPSVYLSRGLICNLDYSSAQCPSPPAYVPRLFSKFTDHMTFPQRLANIFISSMEHWYCYYLHSTFDRIASEFLHRDLRIRDL